MTSAAPILQGLGPTAWVEILIGGLGWASVYILLASGLSLIFGLMGVLNFAHGVFTTIGAYIGGLLLVGFIAENATGVLDSYVPFVLVLVLTGFLVGIIGMIVEVGLVRKLYDRTPIDQILLTFGVALVFRELLLIIVELWTDPTTEWVDPRSHGPPILDQTFEVALGPISFPGIRVFQIAMGILVVVAVWLFLTRTRYGLFIRAGTEDDEMAEALGINVKQVFTVVFGIGIALAGVAGLFVIYEIRAFQLTYLMGAEALLPAFIVVVVGGLGTFKGTVVAAIVAGIAQQTGIYLNTFYLTGISELSAMLLFLLLVAVLILKPQGLYGVEEVGGH